LISSDKFQVFRERARFTVHDTLAWVPLHPSLTPPRLSMVYLRAGTVVHAPSFFEEVLALPIRLYHMLVFFLMTLIDPKAAKQGPGGSGAARSGPRGGSSGAGLGPGGSKRLGGMDTVKGAGNCPPTGG